jgi:hypothetical protein
VKASARRRPPLFLRKSERLHLFGDVFAALPGVDLLIAKFDDPVFLMQKVKRLGCDRPSY